MSVIRLYAQERLSPPVLSQLRSATGRSAVDLAKAASNGAPVAEFVLFKRDHEDVAARVRNLIANVPENELSAVECVVDSKTGLERCHPSSFEVIGNILDEAEQISRDLDATD